MLGPGQGREGRLFRLVHVQLHGPGSLGADLSGLETLPERRQVAQPLPKKMASLFGGVQH